MKFPILIFLFLLFSFSSRAQSDTLVLSGNYQGTNIYVQNPFAEDGKSFCTIKVLVNGKETSDSIQATAFEIDLRKYNFQQGDPVNIQIIHKPGCMPKVLHQWIDIPVSTFVVKAISVDSNYVLHWTTDNENGKLTYIVEQFRWNKWVKVGEVGGQGNLNENYYSFQLAPHSGQNQVRVKQVDHTNSPRCSPIINFISKTKTVKITSCCYIDREILFDTETLWEVYDQNGNLVKKGFGKIIDCSDLKRGSYFINYDNSTAELFKR